MTIDIVSIEKKERSVYEPLYNDLIKMTSKFATVTLTELFPKEVHKAHSISKEASQKAYSKVLEPHLSRNYNILLHPNGKLIDSFEFSKLLNDKIRVKFFIGGAYGFENSFLKQGDKVISLSPLTFSHKIAKVVLLEQIYRGFTLLHNHPYHK